MALMEDMGSQESQQKIEWLQVYIFPALNIRGVRFIEVENLLNFGWSWMWNACIQISFTFTTLSFSVFSYCVSVAIYCPIYFLFSWFLRTVQLSWTELNVIKGTKEDIQDNRGLMMQNDVKFHIENLFGETVKHICLASYLYKNFTSN